MLRVDRAGKYDYPRVPGGCLGGVVNDLGTRQRALGALIISETTTRATYRQRVAVRHCIYSTMRLTECPSGVSVEPPNLEMPESTSEQKGSPFSLRFRIDDMNCPVHPRSKVTNYPAHEEPTPLETSFIGLEKGGVAQTEVERLDSITKPL